MLVNELNFGSPLEKMVHFIPDYIVLKVVLLMNNLSRGASPLVPHVPTVETEHHVFFYFLFRRYAEKLRAKNSE